MQAVEGNWLVRRLLKRVLLCLYGNFWDLDLMEVHNQGTRLTCDPTKDGQTPNIDYT